MKAPSAALWLTAVAQVVIGGVCGLGLGAVPRFGMPGAAAGQVVASAVGAALLVALLRSGRADGQHYQRRQQASCLACFAPFWGGDVNPGSGDTGGGVRLFSPGWPRLRLFGAGMSLFFSTLAAGQVAGLLFTRASRLVIVGLGGLLLAQMVAPLWMVFALITVGMVTYGNMAMLIMARAKWEKTA